MDSRNGVTAKAEIKVGVLTVDSPPTACRAREGLAVVSSPKSDFGGVLRMDGVTSKKQYEKELMPTNGESENLSRVTLARPPLSR